MNQDLISLAIERGRLLERISNQRQLLGRQLQPVGDALETADRAVAAVRKAGAYLGQHPEVVAAGEQVDRRAVGDELVGRFAPAEELRCDALQSAENLEAETCLLYTSPSPRD